MRRLVDGAAAALPPEAPPEFLGPDPDARLHVVWKRLGYYDAPEADRYRIRSAAVMVRYGQVVRLRRWWLERMITSPTPLREKMALFWHGHFATQDLLVSSPYCHWQLNDVFRRQPLAEFRTLCLDSARSPVMLFFLDGASSRREGPNENFAREFLELFTLGAGHYTEDDIRAAARAFTGWTVEEDRCRLQWKADWHDDGRKTFLGRTGAWTGEDIVDIACAHPACGHRIGRKLWEFLAYEEPEPEIVEALAQRFVETNGSIAALLDDILRSEAFYSRRAVGRMVKSPVQWFAGSLVALEASPPVSSWFLDGLAQIGQTLFSPPSVAGWPVGEAWMSTGTLADRYRFAAALLQGTSGEPPLALDALREHAAGDAAGGAAGGDERLRLIARLFPTADFERTDLLPALEGLPDPAAWTEEDRREAVVRLMCTPHFQLL